MSKVFQSTKVIELGSCAFRQWRATHSHCSKLHGYQLKAKFWFACDALDDKNWAVDFGGLKDLKQLLQDQFDHTTCVAKDDPALGTFQQLHNEGVIDLRIMEAVGAEKTAEWVFWAASKFIEERYGERCWIDKVEVFEHEANSAIFLAEDAVAYASEKLEEAIQPTTPSDPEPVYNNSRAAPVGQRPTSGMGGLFAGTVLG